VKQKTERPFPPGAAIVLPLLPGLRFALEKRCHTKPTLLIDHAFIFDVIICCPATYAEQQKTITNRNAGYAGLKLGEPNFIRDFGNLPFGVTKEVVGIHLLLTCSLFGVDILRSLLPRVSPVKSTSVPLRF
jgi:hypothetical protein